MVKYSIIFKYLKISGFLLWIALFFEGLFKYPGSVLVYTFFSLVFLLALVDGFSRKTVSSYSFLIIFIWLGFWLKLIVHLWLNYAYLEPVGYFEGTPKSWDSVLIVSAVGALGMMLGKTLFGQYLKNDSGHVDVITPYAPSWYVGRRVWLWTVAAGSIVLISGLNFFYGIAQSGFIPSLKLPWPLNGLIAWFLGFGLAAGVTTLAYWDYSIRNKMTVGLVGVFLEGLLSSVSSFSRAIYLFHTLPFLMVLATKRRLISIFNFKYYFFIAGSWIFILFVSLILVTLLRFSGNPIINMRSDIPLGQTSLAAIKEFPTRVSLLIVDRWIGLEGVMAVDAYPGKGELLFKSTLQERREMGKIDFYTLNIARAGVTKDDMKIFQYSTIPGAIAFFYYTDSLFFVFLGMMALTLLMLSSERIVIKATNNPFLAAFWGMGVAQTVASFGLGVGQLCVYYAACFGAIACIWGVQTLSPVTKNLQCD